MFIQPDVIVLHKIRPDHLIKDAMTINEIYKLIKLASSFDMKHNTL